MFKYVFCDLHLLPQHAALIAVIIPVVLYLLEHIAVWTCATFSSQNAWFMELFASDCWYLVKCGYVDICGVGDAGVAVDYGLELGHFTHCHTHIPGFYPQSSVLSTHIM